MKLTDIIVTNIDFPKTVISPKGRFFEMKNRPNFGLSFCIEGQITYTKDGTTYVSDSNNVVLLPKGQNYSLIGNKSGLFPVINFDCIGFDCKDILVFPLKKPDVFIKDIQKLSNLFLFHNNNLQIFSLFYNLLHRIELEQLPKNDVLYRALKYIEHNITDPELSNILIAYNCNISEIYLRRIFNKNFNMTPKQYILEIRIQKAKQLLTDSFYSVSAIAEECGFSSLYTFSRCFKERVGISPSEYATQNQKFEI